jgi:hypothetical protein
VTGGRLTYVHVQLEAGPEWLCWCGQLFSSEDLVRACRHQAPRLPIIPGHIRLSRTDGFGDNGLSGPNFTPRVEVEPIVQFTGAERRRAALAAAAVIVIWVMIIFALLLWESPGTMTPAGPVVTPTTYGPPSPRPGSVP